ncbi:MAG: hypothetical protein PHG82_04925 [Candidatus Gracilibacteria bacterium]|nr:hypothetical protein [Candidatus Gracilibacteria bacterium]
MKKQLKQSFLSGLVFAGTVLLSYVGFAAFTALPTQTDNTTLTSTIWNNLVTAINDIGARTDGIYNSGGNIGIGTSSPRTKLDVNGNLNVNGSNYVETAMFSIDATSKANIISANRGYVNFIRHTSGKYYNPNIFEITTDGIKIKKKGTISIDINQDYMSSGTIGYVRVKITKNKVAGTSINSLGGATNGAWDGLIGNANIDVNANDVINVYILGYNTTITSLDPGAWSNYSLMFTSN